jgi:hypothetical protein
MIVREPKKKYKFLKKSVFQIFLIIIFNKSVKPLAPYGISLNMPGKTAGTLSRKKLFQLFLLHYHQKQV